VRGRHRVRTAPTIGFRAVGVAVAVVLIVSGSWLTYHVVASPGCDNTLHLSVAAAPEIAPVVQQEATAWTDARPQVNGRCIAVDVTSADPADVAAAVAGQTGATLNGVGQANGKTRVPDVWIPDSSLWLGRVRSTGPNVVPLDAPSIARSPVVVAMPEPVARAIGWPNAKLSYGDLLNGMTTSPQLHPGIVEPNRDAAGLSGLLGLAGAAAQVGGANAQQATVAVLRALATGRSQVRDDLLRRFPRAADPATIASSLSAAPLSEQSVIAYNATQPPVRLAALYLNPTPLPLDYPYAVLPVPTADKLGAATALRARLSGVDYKNKLAARWLRAADGTFGVGFATPQGAPGGPTPPAPPADEAVVDRALSTWTAVTLPARMLAVIDVSGSMLTPVPTAGGATREQVTVEAAKRGLSLFDDTWAVGLWIFSTLLDGNTDYRQLVPIGPLASQRTTLVAALNTVRPKPNGATGLYDTVLAAYKAVQDGWDPGRVNSVVMLTDGQNEDPQGISLDRLVAELQKAMDPKRPIQVIALGIGTDVSKAELQKITSVTGGGVFITNDPANIADIFLQAIALRPAAR